MGTNKSRRNFIQKMAAAATGLIVTSKTGIGSVNNESKKVMVSNIKALGFQWQTKDPFLFCVHHEDFFPEGDENMGPTRGIEGRQIGNDFLVKDGYRMYHGTKVPGFPGHPHRGFETITVVRKGMVDHSDSSGASGRYGNGDVQWMTAGSGLQHAEMFPLIHKDKDNYMELFQIWLNLPAAKKMVKPHFKMLWSESIPHLNLKDENDKACLVEVIAGNFDGNKAPKPAPDSWAADEANELAIWNIRMEKGAKLTLPAASSNQINRSLFFYKGSTLDVAGIKIPAYHGADLAADEPLLLQAVQDDCHLLILQGRPLNEPVVQHGPFVMNSRAEIQQAFEDYQRTRFGGWPWPSAGPVHPREKGRFAYHADGRKEEKS